MRARWSQNELLLKKAFKIVLYFFCGFGAEIHPVWEQVLGQRRAEMIWEWAEKSADEVRRAEISLEDVRRGENRWEDMRWADMSCEGLRRVVRRAAMRWDGMKWDNLTGEELWRAEKSWVETSCAEWRGWEDLKREEFRWAEKRWDKLGWHKKRWEQLWSAEKSWEKERRHEMRWKEMSGDEWRWDEMRWKTLRRHDMRWDEMGWHRLRWQWDAMSNVQVKPQCDETRWNDELSWKEMAAEWKVKRLLLRSTEGLPAP